MYATLEGIIEVRTPAAVVLNINGIGYEVNVSVSTYNRVPAEGKSVKLHIVEVVGMYGGGTTLYGFLNAEEKNIFLTFKDGLKNTGAKKSLEYLDRAMKSLADFQRAVQERNTKILTSIFGFKKPTAEKIIAMLYDKLSNIKVSSAQKWQAAHSENNATSEALEALVALGYRESQARAAVEQAVLLRGDGAIAGTSELVKLALKQIK
ncbi:MAG: Holliday junction branch migration protein RuvA [Elusimicrobiota bacterium]